MAKQLLEAASQQQIHALVMEGTHVGPDSEGGITEWDLETELVGHIQGAPGIVLANFSPLNVDRLVGFYKATIRTGRTFVVDPYAAMVMQKASRHCGIPDPAEAENIRVYFNHTFTNTCEQKHLGALRDSLWDRRITMDELRAAPKAVRDGLPPQHGGVGLCWDPACPCPLHLFLLVRLLEQAALGGVSLAFGGCPR